MVIKMKPLFAVMKKEFLEAFRTGKLIILLLLFALFGIMNPAVAKLTPRILEMLADTMSGSGLIVTEIQVDALTSWTQFFKNIPMALIALVLIYSDILTKEYKSGTLLLILTKGLPGYKILLAKTVLLISLWTSGYWICFSITYRYNACFWDNGIAADLFFAAFVWYLFGVWIVSLMILFSTLLKNNTEVLLCTAGTALTAYLLNIIPKTHTYTPMALTDAGSLLTGAAGTDAYIRAAIVTVILCAVCIAAGIPAVNRKQL